MRQKKASGGIVHQDSASSSSSSTREFNTLVAKTGTNALSSIPAATWRELEVTVDSGACDTVLPTDQCQEIKLQESEQSKQGLEYEVANGDTIPNLGERRCIMMTENSSNPKRIAFQVADVHKALLSVTTWGISVFSARMEDGFKTRHHRKGFRSRERATCMS